MRKSQAIASICSAAASYHDNYEGKKLLFISYKPSSDECISMEAVFDRTCFLHLTGVKFLSNARYDANVFYDRCLSGKLSPNDFDFAPDGTTELKLQILPAVFSSRYLGAKMMGDFNNTGSKLYTEKLAGDSRACVGFRKDAERNIFVPNTFLNDDIRHRVIYPYQVVAVFIQNAKDADYSESVYYAKKAKWNAVEFPAKYSHLPFPEWFVNS